MADSVPICPKCVIPMRSRTAARGDTRGSQFYGCMNFPNCREVMPVPVAVGNPAEVMAGQSKKAQR